MISRSVAVILISHQLLAELPLSPLTHLPFIRFSSSSSQKLIAIPGEVALLATLRIIQSQEPTLARAKLLKRLREDNTWEYGEPQLANRMLLITKTD